MTAAYEAVRRGHKVTLFEREKTAGGQLRFASKSPFKKAYEEWGAWLASQVKKMGVTLHTGTDVTDRMVEEGKPDGVILATGGEKIKPDKIGRAHV